MFLLHAQTIQYSFHDAVSTSSILISLTSLSGGTGSWSSHLSPRRNSQRRGPHYSFFWPSPALPRCFPLSASKSSCRTSQIFLVSRESPRFEDQSPTNIEQLSLVRQSGFRYYLKSFLQQDLVPCHTQSPRLLCTSYSHLDPELCVAQHF